jgi:hypothetical protein
MGRSRTTILTTLFLVTLTSPVFAGAVMEVGKTSSLTLNGSVIVTAPRDCTVIKDGVCLKLPSYWKGDMHDENGQLVVNGKKMSDFPPCDPNRTINCTVKRNE